MRPRSGSLAGQERMWLALRLDGGCGILVCERTMQVTAVRFYGLPSSRRAYVAIKTGILDVLGASLLKKEMLPIVCCHCYLAACGDVRSRGQGETILVSSYSYNSQDSF